VPCPSTSSLHRSIKELQCPHDPPPPASYTHVQTIGGAVATGTHGSSAQWASLSSQLRAMQFIAPNGTLLNVTPASNLHLWRALGVSVGRLGVLTQVTLRIVPQEEVTRKLQDLTWDEFLGQVKSVQEAYRAAQGAGDEEGMQAALFLVDETQVRMRLLQGLLQSECTSIEDEGAYELALSGTGLL
jgi:FAD/FMN-containing dehydrogenase